MNHSPLNDSPLNRGANENQEPASTLADPGAANPAVARGAAGERRESPMAHGETAHGAMDPVWERASLLFARGGLIALSIAIFAGVLGVLYYIDATRSLVSWLGFQSIRPLHTTFASAWIFLGGLAVVHHYLQDLATREPNASATRGDRLRLRLTFVLWAIAGAAAFVTLATGVSSGREYMGFHPLISIPILAGWACFGINFLRATRKGFWKRPVYVTMWGTGVFFFSYTFAEQHAWLLPGVFDSPVQDLQVQWKACGTLVGSFNLFVYGSLYYVGEKVSGDPRYAHSRMAYALFAVGLLNSFTNFAHHTYHLPQSHLVKWISFVVSMIEILILLRVIWDIAAMVAKRQPKGERNTTKSFLVAAKWWTAGMVGTAIVLSVPPLNALVHGTHVVTGHAMGTEIGIDTMALFAALSFIFTGALARRGVATDGLHSRKMYLAAIGVNVGAAALVIWLHVAGSFVGYTRYLGQPAPTWTQTLGPWMFAAGGFSTTVFLLYLIHTWGKAARSVKVSRASS